MTNVVYYVVRQRGGWGVQYDGLVRSGHPNQDSAIATALSKAACASERGQDVSVRIQSENGRWREERSFLPFGSV